MKTLRLFLSIAIILLPLTAGAWTLPVPSGLTAGEHIRASDQNTLQNYGDLRTNCSTIAPTDNNAALASTLSGISCLLLNHGSGVDTLKLTETGAVAGQVLFVVNTTSNSVAFPDDSGVLAGAASTLAQYDVATFLYTGSIWVQVSLGNN